MYELICLCHKQINSYIRDQFNVATDYDANRHTHRLPLAAVFHREVQTREQCLQGRV